MARCAWCQEEKATLLFSRPDRLGRESFRYLRCERCGLVRLDPRPSAEALANFYPEEYEAFQAPRENRLFRWGRRRLWSKRAAAVRRYQPQPGRALDVGCATGEFLALLREQGWQVQGIEPNRAAADLARQRLGPASVQVATLEEASFPEAAFDLITLWDVLEHLPDPPAALRQVARWLRPGGMLALGVPNLASWDARLFGPYWIGWDAPRHFFLFPDPTLRAILAAAGLPAFASHCLYGDYGAWMLSLDFVLEQRWGKRPAGAFMRRVAGLRPWRYLLWPYFRLAERRGRGPIRTYFCR